MKKNIKNIKWIVIALVCLLVIIISFFINRGKALKEETEKKDWPIKEIVMNKDDFYKIEDLIEVIPKWGELTIAQQFSLVENNGKKYDVRNTKVLQERIGNKIGEVVVKGYDTYTKATYTHNAELYKMKNFPEECVIAVKYENTNEYYVAINAYYKPATLKDFMEDLNLREIVSFGTIFYDDYNIDKDGNVKYESIEFPNVDDNIIWKMLFDDVTVENVYDDRELYAATMDISVNIPLLGYENIGVSVNEYGYLITNILETGKAFYIGEEKVQKFVNYIIENYDGYKIVYVDENGNELSRDNPKDKNVEYDVIMFQNNTTNATKEYIPNSNASKQNFTEPYDLTK